MEQQVLSIGDVARQLLNRFYKTSREDGSEVWLFQSDEDWQHQIIADVSDSPLQSPEQYSAIFRVLLEIFVAENQEQAEEFLLEMEPMVTPGELTAWLHASTSNLHYLTLALHKNNVKEAEDLLLGAYKIYLQNIGENIIRNINIYLNKKEHFEKAAI
ncbi:MAG: hypothetical protein D6732_21975 [Methanobacteriota archaeon]|nr:MAG: hypothetical protein D6732_21975 [Euryarchaeota archaeon]